MSTSTAAADDAAPRTDAAPRFTSALLSLLHHLGVREAYGLVGGAIATFCDALEASPITCYQLRHEAGCLFAAVEASLATGRPTLAFVTTGPGLTNAITGALAARWEGAKVILISGATSPAQRGRWAVQESSMHTLPVGVLTDGAVFDCATMIEHPSELPGVARRLAAGLSAPGGFVAHLALPIAVQQATFTPPAWPAVRPQLLAADPAVLDEAAARLASGRTVIWAGFGARAAADDVRRLAEHTGARVMCTPRGKGVLPEDHPLYLGVTGCGGHDVVERALAEHPADHVLVVGSKLGEFSSCWSRALAPRVGFVQIDVDPDAIGAAYPDVDTLPVVADAADALRGLLARLPAGCAAAPVVHHAPALLALRDGGPVRPRALMAALQRVVVDGSDAAVMAESGNSFAWTNHELRFAGPGRYRVSGLWGSMGHATSGVVGLALARGKAVAVVGDGAMLMMNEVSSAVQYGAPAVWVVLNDAVMGIVDRGMTMLGLRPFHTRLPRTDFVALARALGADGVAVEREADLDRALATALAAGGPFVVDVHVDPAEAAPFARRVSTLSAMSART